MDHPHAPDETFGSLGGADFVEVLTDGRLDALFVNPPRSGVISAWYGHVPFAFWLMQALRPHIFVELGTHNGVSYAAFCESALTGAVETQCFAVDTWQGDEHAGFYDETVFASLQAFHDPRYSAFSRMVRSTFDDAATYFADGSVDLLHIDGCHTYEDVQHDFSTWRPKLSSRAVVVFHDTNVRERHFGVWRLWSDLRKQYPGFAFVHEHGLGILAVGPDVPEPVLTLCRLEDSSTVATIRTRFAQAGRRCTADAELIRTRAELSGVDELKAALESGARNASAQLIEAEQHGEAQLRAARGLLEEAEAARDAAAGEIALMKAALAQERDAHGLANLKLDQAKHEAHRLLAIATVGETEAAKVRASAAEIRVSLDSTRLEIAENRVELVRGQVRLAELEEHASELASTLQVTRTEETRLNLHVKELQHGLDSVTQATSWLMLAPLRRLGAGVPRPVRMGLRRGLRAVWRAVTPWRIPIRRRVRLALLTVRNQQSTLQSAPPAGPTIPPPTPSVSLPPARPVDRFALGIIPPLGGDYQPVVAWYDPIQPEVSIVILNWNRTDMTLLCLQHLWQNTSQHPYEIIVVDNGSAPEEVERLRERAVFARVIPLGVNKFFGEANNIGVEAAHGRYICLMNNDTFVCPGWLAPLVDILATDVKTGAVGPCFRYPDGTLQEAGAMVTPDGTAIQLGKGGRTDDPQFNALRMVDYISAACVLVRRDEFVRVLGFDLAWEPAYYEDVDLCLKLRLIGLQTLYCPSSTVVHIEHATSANQGASLQLDTIVAINRTKFASRWGRYLETMGREKPSLVPDLQTPNPPSPAPGAPDHDKRVLIYTPYNLTPGGGERYILTMVEAFKGISHIALVTPYRLSRIRVSTMGREFGLDLEHVEIVYLDDLHLQPPFDLAFVLGNEIFPSVGRMGLRNIFICQFPFPLGEDAYSRHVRPFWNDFDLILTYSEFVRTNVRRQAAARGVPSKRIEILAPPVRQMRAAAKRPGQILHVGRFFTGGHCKRHDAMIDAFRILVDAGVDAELHLAGSTMPEPQHRAYYIDLVARAHGLPVVFHANCSVEELHQLYAESAIYWHATGVGGDIDTAPHIAEHFGISVIEAMSARCIPIVFGAGGPATVVEDGVNGFHFQTLEQLASRTRQVLKDMPPSTLEAVANAAEAAARAYDEPIFKARVREVSFELMSAWDHISSVSSVVATR